MSFSSHIHTTGAKSVKAGGGTTVVDAFADSFSIKIQAADSNETPSDAVSFAVEYAAADSSPDDFTEHVELRFPPGVYFEASAAPVDARSFVVRVWMSGSAGTGVTNPANANGQNDGAVATLQTQVAGTNPITMLSALGANIPSGVTLTSCVYKGWFRSANQLVTSNGQVVMESIGGLFLDITMFSNSGLGSTQSFLTTPFSFDLFAAGVNTLAKAQSCRVRHRVQDAASGVTPHSMTVDAGCLEIAGAFS